MSSMRLHRREVQQAFGASNETTAPSHKEFRFGDGRSIDWCKEWMLCDPTVVQYKLNLGAGGDH
jgi:hypothetical protein